MTNVTSTLANGPYKAGQLIPIQVTFSEPVFVTGAMQLTLETGLSDAVVAYTVGSGTSTLTFNYTVAAGNTAADLDYVGTSALALISGTIKDSVGNDANLTLPSPGSSGSLGANKNLWIDTTAPVLAFTSINPVSPGISQNPQVTFTVSELVPTLRLYKDAICSTAISGWNTGSAGSNTIATSTLAGNVATSIFAQGTDPAGNTSNCTSLTTYLNDGLAPTVTGVTSTAADGTYGGGQVVPIKVDLSEVVFVTGTPQLTLETGASDAVVNYSSGSGTTSLIFNYTIVPGHDSVDLNYASMSALVANGGSIKDITDCP